MSMYYTIGDLVHIPQAVDLLDCRRNPGEEAQLSIPLRVWATKSPHIGVVTAVSTSGYLQVFCEGGHWSVAPKNVYPISSSQHDLIQG